MRLYPMFVTAVCVLFLIKLRWPKKKRKYMSVWENHTHILAYDCFWGVLDNFRGDIKF